MTLGKAAGMEVILTGTITPLDERIIVLNVLALDVQGAVAIASAKTSIARTPAINILLRTVVGQVPGLGNEPIPPTRTGKDADYEEDMPKSRCEDGGWGYGITCFDNRHNEPLLLYKITQPNIMDIETNILIAPGAEACSPLILTATRQFTEKTFHFRTVGSIPKEGFLTFQVNRCKQRHIALTPSNFLLSAAKAAR